MVRQKCQLSCNSGRHGVGHVNSLVRFWKRSSPPPRARLRWCESILMRTNRLRNRCGCNQCQRFMVFSMDSRLTVLPVRSPNQRSSNLLISWWRLTAVVQISRQWSRRQTAFLKHKIMTMRWRNIMKSWRPILNRPMVLQA